MTAAQSCSRIRVRYAETDAMGIVYYANYLAWFEVGRTDLLRTAGWTYREMEQDGYRLPVLEVSCLYHQPARYDDEIEVRTKGALLSHVRLRFTYDVVRVADEVKLASGFTVHASLDRNSRPCRVPDRVRHLLEEPSRAGRVLSAAAKAPADRRSLGEGWSDPAPGERE